MSAEAAAAVSAAPPGGEDQPRAPGPSTSATLLEASAVGHFNLAASTKRAAELDVGLEVTKQYAELRSLAAWMINPEAGWRARSATSAARPPWRRTGGPARR